MDERDPIRDRALAALLDLAENATSEDIQFSAAQAVLYDAAERERIKEDAKARIEALSTDKKDK